VNDAEREKFSRFFKDNNNMELFLKQVKTGTAYVESFFGRTQTPGF